MLTPKFGPLSPTGCCRLSHVMLEPAHVQHGEAREKSFGFAARVSVPISKLICSVQSLYLSLSLKP